MGLNLKQPRTGRHRKPGGKRLETLVLSAPVGVELVKVPSGVRYLPGGKTARVKSPVDFLGVHRATGRMLAFDCKEDADVNKLDTSASHLAPHQRAELDRLGRAGAVAGVLAMRTTDDALFWLPHHMLYPARSSVPWSEMLPLGTAKRAINWETVAESESMVWAPRRMGLTKGAPDA